jgi:putative membrane protein
MRFLLRVLVSAAALGVATWAIPGFELLAGSGWSRVGTLLAVAVIFGLINAFLKPLIKVVGCAFYVRLDCRLRLLGDPALSDLSLIPE